MERFQRCLARFDRFDLFHGDASVDVCGPACQVSTWPCLPPRTDPWQVFMKRSWRCMTTAAVPLMTWGLASGLMTRCHRSPAARPGHHQSGHRLACRAAAEEPCDIMSGKGGGGVHDCLAWGGKGAWPPRLCLPCSCLLRCCVASPCFALSPAVAAVAAAAAVIIAANVTCRDHDFMPLPLPPSHCGRRGCGDHHCGCPAVVAQHGMAWHCPWCGRRGCAVTIMTSWYCPCHRHSCCGH